MGLTFLFLHTCLDFSYTAYIFCLHVYYFFIFTWYNILNCSVKSWIYKYGEFSIGDTLRLFIWPSYFLLNFNTIHLIAMKLWWVIVDMPGKVSLFRIPTLMGKTSAAYCSFIEKYDFKINLNSTLHFKHKRYVLHCCLSINCLDYNFN